MVAMLFSCTKREDMPAEPDTDVNRIPEEIFIKAAGEDGVMLYSVTQHAKGRKLTFNKVIGYEGRTYSGTVLPDELVSVFDLGTDRLSVTFDDGRCASMDRIKILKLSQTDTAHIRGYIGEPVSFAFDILENTGDTPQCRVTAENVEAYAELDGNRCTISIKSVMEEHGQVQVNLENGLLSATVNITVDAWTITSEGVQEGYIFPEEGGQTQFRVRGDMPDNMKRPLVVSSDAPWLSVETDGDKVTIKAAKSLVPKQRQATVTVMMDGCLPVTAAFSQEDALDNGEGYIKFADRAFRNACLPQVDTDGDGKISFNEAEAITALDVRGKGIKDITGVECFRNIKELDFRDNSVEHADMLTNLPKLHSLDMEGNPLKTFDVSGCQFVFSRCRFDTRIVSSQKVFEPKYKVRYAQVNVSAQCDPGRHGAQVGPVETVYSDGPATDNTVRLLRTHTKGPGYPMVISGVQLIDRELKDGNYKRMVDVVVNTICNGAMKLKPSEYAEYIDFFYTEYASPSRPDPLWEDHWDENFDNILNSLAEYYGPQKMEELGNNLFFYMHVAGCGIITPLGGNGISGQHRKYWHGFYGLCEVGSKAETGEYFECFVNTELPGYMDNTVSGYENALRWYFQEIVGLEADI